MLPSTVHSLIRKLKKKSSSGVDFISARHLKLAGSSFELHLALLLWMILVCGVVPLQFCIVQITRILKKCKKDASLCSSYRPITISCTTFKLFESSLTRDIEENCSTPPRQFTYQRGLGREHALFLLINVLKDIEERGDFPVLCALDVARTVDLCIFSQVLLEALLKGTDAALITCLRYMYRNLKTGIKDGSQLFPILKGVRQGAPTSPVLFNNCVTGAQDKLNCTFIFKGVDLSLVAFVDDLLNLSCTFQGCSSTFEFLLEEYEHIGLSFNTDKTVVLPFNYKGNRNSKSLSGSEVSFASRLTYLGMPIGANPKETVNLAIKNYASKIRAAYASLASNVSCLRRVHRSHLYNSLTKYLMELPTSTSNSFLQRNYHLVNPAGVIDKSKCVFTTEFQKSSHLWSFLFVPCL